MSEKIRLKLSGPSRYLFALVVLGIAIFLRFWVLPVEAGYPHLTIYPATILCFLFFGLGPGLLVTVISALVTFYFFVHPFYSFELTDEALVVLPIYLISSLMLGLIVMKSQNFARELQAVNERLNQTLNSQSRFIENAAHQLRTPLAGLKLQADHALNADNLETMKPALAQIKSAVDRLAHLSTQLLVLARSESISQQAALFKTLDLGQVARECCMDWVPKALERNMDLGFHAPAAPAFISGNATLLRELLGNLLDNAVCYGKPGGKINVEIEVDSQVLLIVEDDGPGIEPEEAEKIFERFYRIPGSTGDGCGLGLAIVKEIADLHAARIGVGGAVHNDAVRFSIAFDKEYIGQTPNNTKPDHLGFFRRKSRN